MPRISQLPSLTAADNSDEIAIVDVSASTTKKITRGDLLKAPLPTKSVTTAAVADNAITADKVDFATFPKIQYGGGNLSGNTTTRKFTPSCSGLLVVRSHSRRNQAGAADNVMDISISGAISVIAYAGIGYGTADAFASAQALATVATGTPVTITMTATNPSNSGYTFFVIPGTTELLL